VEEKGKKKANLAPNRPQDLIKREKRPLTPLCLGSQRRQPPLGPATSILNAFTRPFFFFVWVGRETNGKGEGGKVRGLYSLRTRNPGVGGGGIFPESVPLLFFAWAGKERREGGTNSATTQFPSPPLTKSKTKKTQPTSPRNGPQKKKGKEVTGIWTSFFIIAAAGNRRRKEKKPGLPERPLRAKGTAEGKRRRGPFRPTSVPPPKQKKKEAAPKKQPHQRPPVGKFQLAPVFRPYNVQNGKGEGGGGEERDVITFFKKKKLK